MFLSASILAATFSMGCAPADQVHQLEERLAALESKVATLEKSGTASGARTADPASEEAGKKLYGELNQLVAKGDLDGAKAKLAELKSRYAQTAAYRAARKIGAELEVVGKTAPSDFSKGVEKWLVNESSVDMGNGTTLLVFWEVWCPHCRREVPKLKETYTTYQSRGLNLVGLTKISRSATEDSVNEFINENEVNYPMAKEDGSLSQHFNVSGIPAAAAVKDGKIIWRGHPGRLNDEIINGWL